MIQNWFRSGLILFLLTASLYGQGRDTLINAVNANPGWTAKSGAATYNESTIDTFDTKLAQSLRTFGLEGVTVQTWQGAQGQVKATMFQLLDAGGAYGFFTIRRRSETNPTPESTIGSESFRAGSRLYFWQGSYVVRLEGEPPATAALAKVLAENIVGRSQRPSITNHLPITNLIDGSEAFLLDATDIPKIDGVNSSALGFDSSAVAAVADYRVDGKIARLLLMLYPTQQIAKKYEDQIRSSSPNMAASQKRIGPLLAIVSGTSDASVIQSLLDQVHYQSKVTWNEPKPSFGLGPVIVTVFSFIGMLLGGCVIVGIAFGGFRIFMKARYPNRGFGLKDDAEFIQLKLDKGLTRKELSD